MGSDLIKEKKIEILHDRILRYSSKKEIEISLGNGQIPLCGFELQVIGTAIEAYHSGQKEVIVRGNSGLFYVEVTEELTDNQAVNQNKLRNSAYQRDRQNILGSARRALLKLNSPIDNRTSKRLGIRP